MKLQEKLIRLAQGEIVRYGLAGASVTLVNWLMYNGLLFTGMAYAVANIIALVVSKVYGYLINKFFVYRSHTEGWKETLKEAVMFIFVRGFTGLVDFFGVIALVELAGMGERAAKIIPMIAVIVLNYVLGKTMVFKGKKKQK